MKDEKMTQKDENVRHLALYRKYRPQEFKEVLGQDLAIQVLETAIEQDKIYHAYIFAGDRGTGKTTVARIFAKNIGCSQDDIFELDAASNNKVEDIRLIIDATQASTFGSRYKVYILDEAHMLSRSAFNALLKTLEEPPSHVIFILATTDKYKIPDTIISRCQEINFASPDIKSLEKLITSVSKKEGIEVDSVAKKKIAEEGRGSFRDTLSVLEKILNTLNKKEISLEDVKEIFGTVEDDEIFNVLEAITEKNVYKLLTSLNNLKLETSQIVDRVYVEIVKMFELALFMRYLTLEEAKEIFMGQEGEKLIRKTKALAEKHPKVISSGNLYSLLEIEKELNQNSNLKKSILKTGLIRILENVE